MVKTLKNKILLVLVAVVCFLIAMTLTTNQEGSYVENVTDYQSVNQEGTIEAQGSYVWREE